MTVSNLAVLYGMSVKALCQEVGYTPQGLNRVLKCDTLVYKGKFRGVVLQLIKMSERIAAQEKAVVEERAMARQVVLVALLGSKKIPLIPEWNSYLVEEHDGARSI